MKKKDVPQDGGLFDGLKEICYAVDEAGHFVLEPSVGWDPANTANQQAWHAIRDEAEQMLVAIHAGRRSPLAIYMVLRQMDVGLLANYTGVGRLRIRYHLTPRGFRGMAPDTAARYAQALGVSVEQLSHVPEAIHLPDGQEVDEGDSR